MMGNPALKFSFTKASISSGLPLSCPKNWLQGKAIISKPLSLQRQCALTISLQLSEVNPHLQATFTTMVNFLFLSPSKLKSFPLMSLTLKSKKLGGTGFFNPSDPDLKIILEIRPPIKQNNKSTYHFSKKQEVRLRKNVKQIFLFNASEFEFFFQNCQYCSIILFYLMESGRFSTRRLPNALDQDSTLNKTISCERSPHVQRLNSNKFNKFQLLDQNLVKKKKIDQQFVKIIEQIQPRKNTFYRVGFRSQEKRITRKIFGEVFGIDSSKMKGTMFIGELWSNRQQSKFLKQNMIYMTKLKLMDKLQSIKKQKDEAIKQGSQLQIDIDSSKYIKDLRLPVFKSLKEAGKNTEGSKWMLEDSLNEIKYNLKQLKKNSGLNALINEVKYLQRCQENLGRVERKYFLKMLELQ